MSKALSTALSLKRRAALDDPTLPAILEFQWPSTAIVNAPVPRSARGIVWVIASMVLALVIISALIPIDRVVTAQGIVVSKSPTILVQPLDTAIVRSIDVHEGQQVRAGQLLARLDPTFAAADLATLKAQVSSFDAQVARLKAEAEGKHFSYTGTDPDWVLQASIYANRKAEFELKARQLSTSLRRARRHHFARGIRCRRLPGTPWRGEEYRGDAQEARGDGFRQQAQHAAGHGHAR